MFYTNIILSLNSIFPCTFRRTPVHGSDSWSRAVSTLLGSGPTFSFLLCGDKDHCGNKHGLRISQTWIPTLMPAGCVSWVSSRVSLSPDVFIYNQKTEWRGRVCRRLPSKPKAGC